MRGRVDTAHGAFRIDFSNTGKTGVCFQVLSGNSADLPRTYTVEAKKSLFDSWTAAQGKYDLSVFGPNGFLRAFRGAISSTTKANLRVESRYDVDDDTVELIIVNLGKNDCRITVDNAYGNDRPVTRQLRSGQSDRQQWNLKKTFGRHGPRISASSGRPPGKRPRQRERSGAGPAPELSATRR